MNKLSMRQMFYALFWKNNTCISYKMMVGDRFIKIH
jgi:hypothetical protein